MGIKKVSYPIEGSGALGVVPMEGATGHAGSGQVSVPTATSTVLLDAAAAGVVARSFLIRFPAGVAWYVAYGGAASATSFPVNAGEAYTGSTLEDVRGYQASGGSATANVIVEVR